MLTKTIKVAAVSFRVLIILAASIATNAQIDKQIASIRADANLINKSAAKFEKKSKTIEGISLEGTEATYFTSGRGLKKIVAKIYGETYWATVELYYGGEEMIFAFQRVARYDTHMGMKPPPKVVRVEEKRLYRSAGKTIRILSGKAQLKPGDIEFTESEYEIIELADQLKAGFDN